MTAAAMAALLAGEQKPLSALVSDLPVRFMVKGKIRTASAQRILDGLPGLFLADTLDRLDGLKISRGQTWALVRASGTEPLVRIVVESAEKETAESFYNEVNGAVLRLA